MFHIAEQLNNLSSKELKSLYPLIGEGTYRKVYDLNNGFVVKIAHNANTNKREFNIWKKAPTHLQKYLTPCILDKKNRIIMPKAMPVTFERINFNRHFQELLGAVEYLKFDNELYELSHKLKLFYSDLKLPQNWGIIDGQYKIIDYEMIT